MGATLNPTPSLSDSREHIGLSTPQAPIGVIYMPTNLVERQLQRTPGDVIRGVCMLLISATLVIAGLASAGSLLLSVLR